MKSDLFLIMESRIKMNMFNYFIPSLFVILSIICGILTDNILIGVPNMMTGILCAWYTGKGKASNYLLGFVSYLLMGYVSFTNHLYGLFFLIYSFLPLCKFIDSYYCEKLKQGITKLSSENLLLKIVFLL